MRGCERGERADAGFVTAETAVVLPVLVAFTAVLVWTLIAVAAQIQCVDAARAGARAAARQDPADAVVAVAREAAPHGARITVAREGDQVRVTVVARPPGLGGLPFELREEAVAAAEDAGGEESQESTHGPMGVRAPGGGPGRGQASVHEQEPVRGQERAHGRELVRGQEWTHPQEPAQEQERGMAS